MRVVVIGAGIVGACTAVELLRDGHSVTLVEPGPPGGPQAASFGNGAWISPASVVPMSMPGLWRKVPRMLLDPLGPLTIRPGAVIGLLPWLLRFLASGLTVARVTATAKILSSLLADAPERHARLAAEAGLSALIQRTGLLHIYPTRADFETEALAWRLRRDNGITWTELGPEDLRQREPSLGPQYRFGVLVERGAHCTDPGGYVAGLVRHAEALGAKRREARATGFVTISGKLLAVQTDSGPIGCDRAVISAGARSAALAREAGDWVSLASERGYHVEVARPEGAPRIPVMPSDGRMANTLVAGGLRAAGQVELADIDAPPNWKRADVLLAHLLETFPLLLRSLPPERVTRWMGHRPSTPDGIPVLGPSSVSADIVHAFGHGHVGLASGPISGRIVADVIGGITPEVAIAPFAATRF